MYISVTHINRQSIKNMIGMALNHLVGIGLYSSAESASGGNQPVMGIS